MGNSRILPQAPAYLIRHGINGMKLKVQKFNTIARKLYLNVRVVDHWNRLPASVLSYKIIDIFKSRLDKHFRETGLL